MPSSEPMDDFSHIPNVAYVSPMELKPNRVLIGLGVAFIVIVLGVVGYLIVDKYLLSEPVTDIPKLEINKKFPTKNISTPSAQKSETADWKVVTNDKLGYSIKYPDNWATYKCEGNPADFFDDSNEPINPKLKVCGTSAVADITIYRGGTFNEEVAQWDKIGQIDYSNYKKKEIIIEGRKAVNIYAVSKENLPTIQKGVVFIDYIIDTPKEKAFVIGYKQLPTTELIPSRPNYTDILEKMVSTFKLLD